MPANRKPKAWNLKPQLTAAPELWRGCVSFLPMWEGLGSLYDIVSGGVLPLTFGTSGLLLTDKGMALTGTAGRVYSVPTVPFDGLSGSSPRTTAYYMREFAANSAGSYYFSIGSNSTGNTWRMRFDADRPRVEAFGGFSTANYNMLGKGWVCAVHTNPGDDVANTAHYIDGVNVGVASSASQSLNTDKIDYTVLSRNNDQIQTVENIEMAYIAHWSRELSEAEIKALARDPYIMLRPAGF